MRGTMLTRVFIILHSLVVESKRGNYLLASILSLIRQMVLILNFARS